MVKSKLLLNLTIQYSVADGQVIERSSLPEAIASGFSEKSKFATDLGRWVALIPGRDSTAKLSIGVKERAALEFSVERCFEDNDGT